MSLLNYSNPFFPPGPAVPQYYTQQTTPHQNNQQQQPLLYGPASRQPFTQPPNKGYSPRGAFTTTRRYDAYDDDDYSDDKKSYDDESYDDKYQANSKREADERVRTATETPTREQRNTATAGGKFPGRPIEYKKVRIERPKPPALHPIIDYDNDYYYEDDTGTPGGPAVRAPPLLAAPLHVTPIQGPIFLKNGTIPVVPLYAYPVVNNGTFLQIPILWTALSVALGLELRGDIVRGVPCIKRYHQLFCPTAGNNYPIDRIEQFIDENKALMKRMYGDFTMGSNYGPLSGRKRKRETAPGVPDVHLDPGPDPMSGGQESYFAKLRNSRQASPANQSSESGRVDSCESKVEIVTPYWAANSAGKVRAVVNTQHFEQAIHQEICTNGKTGRCSGDCGCEQKYKWHRLLAYDPDDDCHGIFMDWFLFPSCCVCKCNPT